MNRLPRSLQGRLLALVLFTVATIWLVAAVTTGADVRHELDELLDSHLAQAAALLVVQQSGEIGDDDERALDAPLLHRYAPRVAFQVFHEGRLALRSAGAPATPMLSAEAGSSNGFHTVRLAGTDWRLFVAHGAEQDIQVYVGEQMSSRAEIQRAVLRNTVQPLLWALPLLALVVWWAVRQGMAPLRGLGRTLAARQAHALQPLAADGAPAEMQPMLAALNGLFVRIGTLMEGERRFTADAAHELRTPIAAIRMQAQVALGAGDSDSRRAALLATLEGCDRAQRLVGQLLTLSRLDAGSAAPAVPTELGAVVREVVAELAPPALDKAQQIAVDAPQPCTVAGDAALLAVLVRNLVDNAIRYSPPGSSIHVGVEAASSADRSVQLRVEDSGPGLSDTDRERLGERFFRVLGSGQSGSGLGWSIVRRVVAVLSAEVELGRSARLGGLAVTIRWPAVARGAGDPSNPSNPPPTRADPQKDAP